MKKPRTLSILLHAHLPYGFRVGQQISLEQAWLYEAVTNCYLPLLDLLGGLKTPKAPWLTLSLSPTLLEQWTHPEFSKCYKRHLDDGLKIIECEAGTAHHPLERRQLALTIKSQWEEAKERFTKTGGELAAAFSKLAQEGKIELITTAATHPFLPAFQNDRSFRHFQIENGVNSFKQHTGLAPKGFWLPECAYFHGLENDLERFGVEYFVLEEQGLTRAQPPSSVREPMVCSNGLLALARDNALSQKVWNARVGYPGHPHYREFHHDGIQEVDTSTCGNFALPDGGRLPFGLKYWQVTGKHKKEWYAPKLAQKQAQLDAADFVENLLEVNEGLILLPFDAELFGHWWHEGPIWLEHVLKRAAELPHTKVQCAGQAAKSFKAPPQGQPAASTWGRNSDYSFWINRDTDWIYPLLQQCSHELGLLVRQHGLPKGDSKTGNALRQAGRELLLASASDWPFMLRAGATGYYAMEQLREHIQRFHFLANGLQDMTLEMNDLELLYQLNPSFQKISLKSFANNS